MKCFEQSRKFGSVKDYDLIVSSLLVNKDINDIPDKKIDHIIEYFEFLLNEAKKLRSRKRN